MSELKPCGCGEKARWCGEGNKNPEDDHECHQIRCDNCGIQFDVDSSEANDAETPEELKAVVAKAWNTRTPQSEWISVDINNLPFGREIYVQKDNGRCGVGEFIDCGNYVRFKFNGESSSLDYHISKPVRYTELPTPPKGE